MVGGEDTPDPAANDENDIIHLHPDGGFLLVANRAANGVLALQAVNISLPLLRMGSSSAELGRVGTSSSGRDSRT